MFAAVAVSLLAAYGFMLLGAKIALLGIKKKLDEQGYDEVVLFGMRQYRIEGKVTPIM